MDSQQWRKLKSILEEAIVIDPHKREAWLEEACGGDEELKQEVLVYLEMDEDTGMLAGGGMAMGLNQAANPLSKDQKLGPYRIERELGEGGMGIVYLAWREDDVHIPVAIKVLKKGMDTREILARFHRERQILAELDHPHIARFLDSGVTPDGMPYFVMEHVEGQPIDQWCDAQGLSVRQRLDLFFKVCDAVSFAHGNLFIHRDLKPGNILVTSAGRPKLLDFGIAGVLDPMTMTPNTLTSIDSRSMTLSYAAPEQVRGERLNASCDVYALGVILYRLLCGRKPYRLEVQLPDALSKAVLEQIPEPMSKALFREAEASAKETARARGLEPLQLKRQLEGDLDNIVAMSLHKEQSDRYASVESLRADLERCLSGHPVIARAPTYWYRLTRFWKRNKALISAVSAFITLVLAFSAYAVYQSRITARERDTALGVLDYMVEVFQHSDPANAQGKEISARQLLRQGRDRIEDRFQDRPMVRARLMTTIGLAFQGLGDYEEAYPLLKEALTLNRQLYGAHGEETAQSLNYLAVLHHFRGEVAEAEAHYLRALETAIEAKGNHNTLTAQIKTDLGSLRFMQNRLKEAESLTREALQTKESLLGRDDPALAMELQNLAAILFTQGESQEAGKLYARDLALVRNTLGVNHPEYLSRLNNLAMFELRHGSRSRAEELGRELVQRSSFILGEQHPQLAHRLQTLGFILRVRGKWDESEEALQHAYAIRLLHFGPGHATIGESFFQLGMLEAAQMESASAASWFRKALAIQRKALPEGAYAIGETLTELVMALTDQGGGELQEAASLIGEAVQAVTALNDRFLMPRAEFAQAWLQACEGKGDLAEPQLLQSFKSLSRQPGNASAARHRATRFYLERQQPACLGHVNDVSEF